MFVLCLHCYYKRPVQVSLARPSVKSCCVQVDDLGWQQHPTVPVAIRNHARSNISRNMAMGTGVAP